jgi:DNA repair exonuclease SbcCD ATPase subunit
MSDQSVTERGKLNLHAERSKNMTSLEKDLKTAKAELEVLQAELPKSHSLVTDSEREVQRLRTERASLDEQAQAKGRAQIAGELLEQHRSELQASRDEVARLEQELQRERDLDQMAEHAKTAAVHKAALDKRLASASTALERAVTDVLREHDALAEACRAFSAVSSDESLAEELRARGVELVGGPDPLHSYPFPGRYGGLIWGEAWRAFQERWQQAHAAQVRAKAAERRQLEEARPSWVIAVSPLDAGDAEGHLGELVTGRKLVKNGAVEEADEVLFSVNVAQLERAEARLKEAHLHGRYSVRHG